MEQTKHTLIPDHETSIATGIKRILTASNGNHFSSQKVDSQKEILLIHDSCEEGSDLWIQIPWTALQEETESHQEPEP